MTGGTERGVPRLDGRAALVTGGARGIGLAIARALREAGADVLIADPGTGIDGYGADRPAVKAAAAEIGALGHPESTASPSAAAAAVERVVTAFGGIDIVVNNAAILRDAFLFKADPYDIETVLRANLMAPYWVLRAATPHLRAQAEAGRGAEDGGWGRIVQIVSTAGLHGNYGQAAYAGAKAGLIGLTRVAALDMARSGVTANAVAPFAATRVTESIRPRNEAQVAYKQKALTLPADRVGAAVAWLCGPAAQDVTGQVLAVRGREITLYTPARRTATAVVEDGDIGAAVAALAQDFVPLQTDLEAYDADPLP